MRYNNLAACMCWLRMMYDRSGGSVLLGNDPESVARAVGVYDINLPFMQFFAEIPFIGDPGVDISVQYNLDLFQQENILQGRASAPEGEFFHSFARRITGVKPEVLAGLHCFLEADTSKGVREKGDSSATGGGLPSAGNTANSDSQFSIFINNGEAVFKPFLSDILTWQNLSQRQSALEKIFAKVSNKLTLWNFGVMNSRPGRPIRLDFQARNYGAGAHNRDLVDLLAMAEVLGLESFVRNACPTLELLNSLNIFSNYTLDIELLPDGSIGPRVGFEMLPPAPYPTLQRSVLSSVQFKRFANHLVECGLADQRIYALSKCLFDGPFADSRLVAYYVYSYISHFKLVWVDGQPQLGKIYLEMMTLSRRTSINETLSQFGF